MGSEKKCRECGKSGCYRCVPPDRATPMPPADVQAATKWLSGQVEQGWMYITESHHRKEWAHISTLLAHLQRQDTP